MNELIKNKPTEEEIINQVKMAYTLAKCLNIQYAWIREYLNPEFRKIISEAKAKNAYFTSRIDRNLPEGNPDIQTERAFEILEKAYLEMVESGLVGKEA